jgi:hypothetical protein
VVRVGFVDLDLAHLVVEELVHARLRNLNPADIFVNT